MEIIKLKKIKIYFRIMNQRKQNKNYNLKKKWILKIVKVNKVI